MKKKILLVIIFSIVIIISIYFISNSFTQTNYNSTNPQDNNSLEKTKIEENNLSGLYKSPTSFEGYRYCSFVVEKENVNLFNRKRDFQPLCNITKDYPIVHEFFYDTYKIEVDRLGTWQFAAAYFGNGTLILNELYPSPEALALTLAHEITHSATESLNLPPWLNEGIASYLSQRYLHISYLQGGYYFDGILEWSPNFNSKTEEIVRFYTQTAYAVRKFTEKYGDDSLKNLLIELDGKISRDDDINTKNQKVLETIQKITNNNTITLKDIVNPK